ncbi:MAG: elongation factor 1-beta [Candidatus Pacearchaeota archaeon]|nr:elongation factor 1-beta [Candidatus Pacearchaeota archaeon]
MAIVSIIVKIMPESPSTNLEEIKSKAKNLMELEGAKNISFETKPIAFGLNAIMMKFAWQEEKDTSIIENSLSQIPNVSSAQIIDYRRAFG